MSTYAVHKYLYNNSIQCMACVCPYGQELLE